MGRNLCGLGSVGSAKEKRQPKKPIMSQTSLRQRKTTGRIMHEYKYGELKSGLGSKAGKIKSRGQAIAIALKQAGASKYESADKNQGYLAKLARKEVQGKTYQQEREGKSHVSACDRRESSRGMGGMNKQKLYRRAQARGIEGRSKMSRAQLENALW
jgi:hypothetical protein